MNIRLYNAHILTMEKGRNIFRGEVWIKDEKIVYVPDEEELAHEMKGEGLPELHWDKEIDCEGNLLMPGFKNAHTHSAMTLMRSLADDMPLDKWLNEKIFPAEAKLTPEDIYQFVKLAILEYLSSGITSIFDMYLVPEATAMACQEMGMRCVLVSGLNDFTSSIEQTEEEFVKWNQKKSLISYKLGCHAEYTCSRELLIKLSGLAHKYRAPVYMHMSETSKEVRDCVNKYGMTPAVFMDSLGMFDFGGGAYHCVHFTNEDMDVFRRRRLHVITNPGSNAKLASGVAPIKDFLDKKIPVALGTDGAASNNCLDMFREMFLVAGLSNLREMDAASVDAMEILRMATVNGAKAMGLSKADVLAKGKLADIIMIDLQQPNMQPIHNMDKNIVYSGSKSNIKMTIINGKILYKNGEYFVGEKPSDIYKTCEMIARRIFEARE
ncbi:MAG: amidohydrolase [Lachnospiraceae bacterium]|nr:amidohydrolase [Lachnospiraceae bacterium]